MKDFTENLLLALNDSLYQISLGENTVRNLESFVLASRKARFTSAGGGNILGQLDDFEHNDDFHTSHDYKLSK